MAVGVGVMVLAGCGVIDGAPVSRGEPTTPAPAGPAVSAERIDALVVPVTAVPEDLHPESARTTPQVRADASCAGDDATWFGAGSVAFRHVRYSGLGNLYVAQAIGVYSSAQEAASVFRAAAQRLQSCGDAPVTVDAVSADRATWHVTDTSPVSGLTGTMAGYNGGVVGNVVFRVGAGIFDDPVAVAQSVADGIVANVRAG
jgi:hypothetical protein